jgi:RHS repeat-associated protein
LAGGIVATNVYDAWGNRISNVGTIANSYLYAGEQFDSDLGLYYNRARYYSPDAGRFWTMDTYAVDKEDVSSLHKYLYAAADPVNRSDPLGLTAEDIDFGRAVEKVVRNNFYTKAPSVRGNTEKSLGKLVDKPARGILARRVDLYHKDNVDNFFFEIKHCTLEEMRKGAEQIADYNFILNHYAVWRPGNVSDYYYWGPTGPLIMKDLSGLPLPGGKCAVIFPPVGGLITYVKIDPPREVFRKFIEALVLNMTVASVHVGASASAVSAVSVTVQSVGATATLSSGVTTTVTYALGAEVGVAANNARSGVY